MSLIDQLIYEAVKFTIDYSAYWLPIFLIIIFWKTWINYVQADFFANLDNILLEIKLPQEILKSPQAMETFLMVLSQKGGESTFIDRYWKGQMRASFSLEIVSIEGDVKFYIFAQKKFKGLIENGLYAQYPGIEIHLAQDYSKSVHFNPDKMGLHVFDIKKAEKDFYPIKTYADYNIDTKDQLEEENKVDPINQLIEFMGSIGKDQQVWLQIIIRAHKAKPDPWKDGAKKEIEKIQKEAIPKSENKESLRFPNPTKGQLERIAAIERQTSKIPFDVGMRAIYFGAQESFDKNQIGGLKSMLQSYTAPHLNSFKSTGWLDNFDYPWQDFKNRKQNKTRKKGLEAYKRRSFFYPPFIGTKFIMNNEELASVFHFPGRVTATPTLTRIPSKKSEAPSNLPI
ncbi:MAG: hypothetical protein NUV47_03385 [Patescibacteria group bacterium]|nr:hypothetical protein [Patescibacteria group bacterium]